MTFSWYRSPEALPALGVGQWAPVSTGFSGILALRALEVPCRFVLNAVPVNGGPRDHEQAVDKRTACSLNSATVIPLGANP